MEILIKNMVCRHCVAAVHEALTALGLTDVMVELGKASFGVPASMSDHDALRAIDDIFTKEGFERISDTDSRIVEAVKHAVMHHLRDEQECRLNLSACISDHIGIAYDQASRVFSRMEGRTIERYHIMQKVEYVKELLGYGNLNLSEIADMTGYSSAAHLSRQFKDVTGMTPTQYIHSGASLRKSLDTV